MVLAGTGMPISRLNRLDDPRLDPFRSLKTQNAVRDARQFIAEGPTVVERVFRSGLPVHGVVISDRKYDAFASCIPDHVDVYRLTQELAEQLVGFAFHAGVVACASRPAPPVLADLAAGMSPKLVLAADRVTDPENVGAFIRIASAFGAAAVILGPGSADAFSRRVLRVSMGNVLFQPVLECRDLSETMDELVRTAGFAVCATVLSPTATDVTQFRFPDRTVLLFGNEFDGLSAEMLTKTTCQIGIPMLNGTDSLNVAVAAGIFAYLYRVQHPIAVR